MVQVVGEVACRDGDRAVVEKMEQLEADLAHLQAHLLQQQGFHLPLGPMAHPLALVDLKVQLYRIYHLAWYCQSHRTLSYVRGIPAGESRSEE